MVAMYAPGIVKNLQHGSPHPISRWFTQPIHSAGTHHGVCIQNGLAMQTTLMLVVVSHIEGSTQFPEHT